MAKKYGIIIAPENKPIRTIPNSSDYGILDKHKLPMNCTDKELIKLCNKIENTMEEILDLDIKIKFEVLLDRELGHFSKKVYNRLGTVKLVDVIIVP